MFIWCERFFGLFTVDSGYSDVDSSIQFNIHSIRVVQKIDARSWILVRIGRRATALLLSNLKTRRNFKGKERLVSFEIESGSQASNWLARLMFLGSVRVRLDFWARPTKMNDTPSRRSLSLAYESSISLWCPFNCNLLSPLIRSQTRTQTDCSKQNCITEILNRFFQINCQAKRWFSLTLTTSRY